MSGSEVAVVFGGTEYCGEAPFHPHAAYPEYPFSAGLLGSQENPAYHGVRELFGQLGMDAENHGTERWNPLGALAAPGGTVLLKPNFVVSRHGRGGELFSAITHPSVLRALVDYAFLAVGGQGRIVIADAPQMDCDFDQLLAATGLEEVRALYRREKGFELEIVDLRDFCLADPDEQALAGNRRRLRGDPLGEVVFDLGGASHLADVPNPESYYGADYDRRETIRHHHDGVHEYSVSRSVLAADLVISVPKMKVHKKVGVTLNIKGLVGINTNKNYLVHYRLGTPSRGGDQLPDGVAGRDRALVRAQRWLFDRLLARQSRAGDALYNLVRRTYKATVKPFVRVSGEASALDGGNWHGNDTAWRMAADLLKVFLYGDAEGRLHRTPQRNVFCVVDGICGGEGDGPLFPDARRAGCLVGGTGPLAVDLVATRLMGFDPAAIRQFSVAQDGRGFDLGVTGPAEIVVRSPRPEVRAMFGHTERFLAFRPHPGWVGKIEIDRAGSGASAGAALVAGSAS